MASADAPRQRTGALAQSDVLCQVYGTLLHRVLQTRNPVYRPGLWGVPMRLVSDVHHLEELSDCQPVGVRQ